MMNKPARQAPKPRDLGLLLWRLSNRDEPRQLTQAAIEDEARRCYMLPARLAVLQSPPFARFWQRMHTRREVRLATGAPPPLDKATRKRVEGLKRYRKGGKAKAKAAQRKATERLAKRIEARAEYATRPGVPVGKQMRSLFRGIAEGTKALAGP
jgi:serine/threonine protein kinase HipA of HipAB toxin-antitoxin module